MNNLEYETALTMMIREEGAQPECALLAMFLKAYRPAHTGGGGADHQQVTRMTSQDLRIAMEDMADIPLQTVATVMLKLGYGASRDEYGAMAWDMEQW